VERQREVSEERVEAGLRELESLGFGPVRERTESGARRSSVERAGEMLDELRERGMLPTKDSRERRAIVDDRVAVLGEWLDRDRASVLSRQGQEQALKDRGVHLDQWIERKLRTNETATVFSADDALARRQQMEVGLPGNGAELSEHNIVELPESGTRLAVEQTTAHQAAEITAPRASDAPGLEM
jgi:hypothetical protein